MTRSRGAAGRIIVASAAFTLATAGFMLTGLARTKLVALEFGGIGIATIGQATQLQTLLVVLGAVGVSTAARVLILREGGSAAPDSLVSSLFWFPVLSTTLLVAAASFWTTGISVWWFGTPENSEVVLAALFGAPFAVGTQVTIACAQAMGLKWRLLVAAFGSAVIGIAVTAVLVLSGSLQAAAWTLTLAPLSAMLTVLGVCWPLTRRLDTRPTLANQATGEVVSLASASFLLGVAAALVEAWSRGTAVREVGLVEMAAFQPVALIAVQLSGMAMSSLSTSTLVEVGTWSRWDLAHRMDNLLARLIPLVSAGAILLALLAVPLGQAFFTADLAHEARKGLAIAIAGEPFRAGAWIMGAALLPQGWRRSWTLLGLATVAVQGCLAVLLLNLGVGIESLAWGIAAASVASFFANWVYFRLRGVRLGWFSLAVAAFSLIIILTLALLGTSWWTVGIASVALACLAGAFMVIRRTSA